MKSNKVPIQALSQISIQSPLCDEWMQNPIIYDSAYARSIDPDFKKFLSPVESRRMGKILKRALATSLETIHISGLEHPEAIITGTGLGCIENTEIFLNALSKEGEDVLMPTCFMQSTHNTISSLISIHTKTHGYNATYSHKGMSFDGALLDAWTQFQLNQICSALVGSHDEVTPSYFALLQKIGFVGCDKELCGEAAVSVMLSRNADNVLCLLSGIKLAYQPSVDRLRNVLESLLNDAGVSFEDIDVVLTGINGNDVNDKYYFEVSSALFGNIPLLHYKHIFGESYSASGLGFYVAARCLQFGSIPAFLYLDKSRVLKDKPKNILLFNQYEGKNYSFTLLESICGK